MAQGPSVCLSVSTPGSRCAKAPCDARSRAHDYRLFFCRTTGRRAVSLQANVDLLGHSAGRRAVTLRGKTASRGPSAIDNGHSAFFVHCNYHFSVSFSPSCPISNYQLFLRGHAPGSFVGTACLAAERNQRPDSGPCSLNNKT